MLPLSTSQFLSNQTMFTEQECVARRQLAAAYHIFQLLNMDDLTYTHLSIRGPDQQTFYIYPFGHLFDEVTASSLLRVGFDGQVLEGCESNYNQTGYIIHSQIYQARPDINAVFHFHTPAGVAVSAHPQGLRPLSQWALHCYEKIAYHDYDSLTLNGYQGRTMTDDLGPHMVMFMRHHGSLTCGTTIQQAFFYAYHLEKACKTQCLMLGQRQPLSSITDQICKKSVNDIHNFETDLGMRDWQAMLRKLERLKINYYDL